MRIVLATEIHGRSAHVETLAARLSAHGRVEIVDPYEGKPQAFAGEAEAYAAFLAGGGHAAYAEHLAGALKKSGPDTFLLGFSAGAGAAWLAAADPALPRPLGLIGFYGSRIREAPELTPRCPAVLVWPVREEHFDVDALAARLARTPGVTCLRTPYGHGFMNPLSLNFDAEGAARGAKWLEGVLGTAAEGAEWVRVAD
jgi:dienelactone hydrolase